MTHCRSRVGTGHGSGPRSRVQGPRSKVRGLRSRLWTIGLPDFGLMVDGTRCTKEPRTPVSGAFHPPGCHWRGFPRQCPVFFRRGEPADRSCVKRLPQSTGGQGGRQWHPKRTPDWDGTRIGSKVPIPRSKVRGLRSRLWTIGLPDFGQDTLHQGAAHASKRCL